MATAAPTKPKKAAADKTATTGGKKIFGRAVATAKLA
jgi:hypothetical protein